LGHLGGFGDFSDSCEGSEFEDEELGFGVSPDSVLERDLISVEATTTTGSFLICCCFFGFSTTRDCDDVTGVGILFFKLI